MGACSAPPRNCQGQRGYHGALNTEGGKRWIDVCTRTMLLHRGAVSLRALPRVRWRLGSPGSDLRQHVPRPALMTGRAAPRLDQELKGPTAVVRFPQHKNGLPLLHILNYLNTYSEAYKTTPGQVGAVGTFYGTAASPASRSRSTTRCGRSTISELHGSEGWVRKASHAECLEQADTRRSESPMEGYQSPPISC